MKETKNISLSGIAFTMDAEAVEALNDYLDKLNRFYEKTDGGNEIVTDIETRIAELILDKQDNKTVVSLARIQSIISQLGSPEDIEEESPEQAHHTAPTSNISRRLYRNGERAKLGGVCAGLGTYFDIDPAWIRIGIFVPLLLVILLHNSLGAFFAQLFGVFVLLYIILWFAIPMAKTARQKLEMTGEKIDASTIANRTMSAREIQEEKTRSVISEIMRNLGQIILFLFKVLGICIMLCLIVGIISLIVVTIQVLSYIPVTSPMSDLTPTMMYIISIGAAISIILPLALLSYILLGKIFNFHISKRLSAVVGVIWIVIFAVTTVLSITHYRSIAVHVNRMVNGYYIYSYDPVEADSEEFYNYQYDSTQVDHIDAAELSDSTADGEHIEIVKWN